MARFANGASGRLGKRSRNVSETVSLSPLSSWGSEVNVHSDVEESNIEVPRKRRLMGSAASSASPDQDLSGKGFSSSDDEFQQPSSSGSTRGKKPKCFSRNAVLARQNRLKKKKYIEDLENELHMLRRENSKLKVSLDGYSKDVELVRKENIYLRNVLANSKEITHLIRSINVNCGLPSSASIHPSAGARVPTASNIAPRENPKVMVESAVPAPTNINSDSCVPYTTMPKNSQAARTVKKDFPIAADDVPLSLSAPEDEDDLDMFFGTKDLATDLDFNLNEAPSNDLDCLGFGPNAFGDWLDGDEPLSDIGVCLHVAKNKVSLEFCASCNENALSSWSGITA